RIVRYDQIEPATGDRAARPSGFDRWIGERGVVAPHLHLVVGPWRRGIAKAESASEVGHDPRIRFELLADAAQPLDRVVCLLADDENADVAVETDAVERGDQGGDNALAVRARREKQELLLAVRPAAVARAGANLPVPFDMAA